MQFTKMHGCGNDYVYVDLFKEKIDDPEAFAIKVSHRQFGIGSDGLIMIGPTKDADIEMIMFNADGSKSEMCGNGVRCVAKYAVDHNLIERQPKTIEILTGDGVKKIELIYDENYKVENCIVEMGVPILDGLKIPTNIDQSEIINHPVQVLDIEFQITCVSMGNPHCIVYVDDVKFFEVEKYGSILENHELFPNRVNVEFVQIVSPDEVIQRTWERGSGETWACGTGASAVCVAGILTHQTNTKILNHLTGGDLTLEWKGPGEPLYMTGPAEEVFTGSIEI
ncbi:MAG: diaminopimelate epimerase [Planctomycetota bacterium]|nr:MAG: diaminopimelate epimerase [Planctomycetota bacterium]